MKISHIETFMVNFGVSNYIFVKVHTDEGIDGIGEATLEGKELSVLGAIQELARNLIGQNPLDIEHHWRKWHMTSCWKGVTDFTAISGIEQALWDITGKYFNTPVYRLWGGPVREAIRAYTWPGPYETPEECGEAAAYAVEKLGYTGLKFDPFRDEFFTISPEGLDHAVRCIRAAREAVGGRAEIAVDGHWRFGPQAAIKIARALEPFDLLFFEEPVPSDANEMLARVRAEVNVPLATGERYYTRWGFWSLLRDRLVDIIQPDICHAGGILELRKIAAMAEPCGVTVAPHNPNGPVSLAAVVQFAACTPNFLITESVHTRTLDRELVKEGPQTQDGFIPLPTKPGLGIELNEEVLQRYPGEPKDIWFPPKVVY
jgi:galactonate dehydratase